MNKQPKFRKVKVDLSKEVLYELMLTAHEQDITLNQLCNNIIYEEIQKEINNAKKEKRKETKTK